MILPTRLFVNPSPPVPPVHRLFPLTHWAPTAPLTVAGALQAHHIAPWPTRHYSPRTEEAYVAWIRRFILFHGKRHPREMGAGEIEVFLTHLAAKDRVAASTQNQALSALLFLYRYVLRQPIDTSIDAVRAQRPKRLPTVLAPAEVRRVIDAMTGTPRLMAMLLYGSGLRLGECVSLRLKDIDFERYEITVREAKGDKDRVTMLPANAAEPLQHHLERIRAQHVRDLAGGHGHVTTRARARPQAAFRQMSDRLRFPSPPTIPHPNQDRPSG